MKRLSKPQRTSVWKRAKCVESLVALCLFCGTALFAAPSWAQTKIPRVGVLALQQQAKLPLYETFERVLADRGWVAGKNVVLEYRAPDSQLRFRSAVEELLRLKVDVIYASSAPALKEAYAATRDIPIIALDFTHDPVAAGFAESYGRPGRNVAGVFLDAPEFTSKWLEILKALKPGLSRVAVLWDPSPGSTHLRGLEKAAKSLAIGLQVSEIRQAEDIDQAFASMGAGTDAVILMPAPLMYAQSARVGALTRERGLLGIAIWRRFAEAGGAVSYGPDFVESIERSALILAKVLSGAKPGDLPIERPNKFELVLNRKTIKALGLSVPDTLLLRAEEVIQ